MNRETKPDHLEGVSLLSAGLTPGVELRNMFEHFRAMRTTKSHLRYFNSLNVVTPFKSTCVVTGGLASQDVKG
jgi:hypothetical protein